MTSPRRRAPALVLLLCALAPLSASSCGEREGSADDFSVALLLAGPENDGGWNQAAYEGLQRIAEDRGARVRKVRAATASEIDRAMRRAASEHFDLVLGHGFEFNEPASRVAAENPAVVFATTGGVHTAANLATVVLRVEEVAYALGVIAGRRTRTGIVSALSGERFEPVVRVVAGFRRGFLSVRPDGQVLEDYLGSWEDSLVAKEKALAHANAGADLFFQNADAAGIGIFEACRSRGLRAFGCNRDQAAKAPDVVLASAVADIPEAFVAIAAEVQEGRFHGGERSFGLKEHAVSVAYNEALVSELDADLRGEVERCLADIAAGTLDPIGR